MNTFTPFAIVSACRHEYDTEVNAARTEQFAGHLDWREIPYRRVLGSYKGVRETSFLVELPGSDERGVFDQLLALGRRYGQEGVLFVDANRRAAVWLTDPAVRTDHSRQQCFVLSGRFQQVTEADAMQRDSWTQDEEGRYYAVA